MFFIVVGYCFSCALGITFVLWAALGVYCGIQINGFDRGMLYWICGLTVIGVSILTACWYYSPFTILSPIISGVV